MLWRRPGDVDAEPLPRNRPGGDPLANSAVLALGTGVRGRGRGGSRCGRRVTRGTPSTPRSARAPSRSSPAPSSSSRRLFALVLGSGLACSRRSRSRAHRGLGGRGSRHHRTTSDHSRGDVCGPALSDRCAVWWPPSRGPRTCWHSECRACRSDGFSQRTSSPAAVGPSPRRPRCWFPATCGGAVVVEKFFVTPAWGAFWSTQSPHATCRLPWRRR